MSDSPPAHTPAHAPAQSPPPPQTPPQREQRTQPRNTRKTSYFGVHALSGGVGSTIAASITCPLEVVKTRQQSSLYKEWREAQRLRLKTPTQKLFSPFITTGNALAEVYHEGGIRALWRGLGPNLVGVIPARSIYFGMYGTSKAWLAELNGREESWVHMVSAAVAGATSATVTSPIWLVKTRMQLQSGGERQYRNSFHCFQSVLKNEGVRGLYKGTSASYLGISESTIQFVLYEWLKKLYRDRRRSEKRPPTTYFSVQDWVDSFVVAATAKLLASAATYPHEVVRTRLRERPPDGTHSKYNGLIQTFRVVYREEGFRGLYGGMSTHLIRVVPNAAIMFTVYELSVYMLGSKS
ncbi:mitochondrial carrier [Gonapodya prolifera JEL478]|uniref:Mitochondrial carrier n=1 Tax=Gonapodya prolifera (strain JEL478) TaxID=1344416 RepID=A0A139A4W1_GONPJ|nr:mitochondrial carrier [Gonapodya prolifera JEL478]|eukprot:KXS11659.1 mitochondrial carrier [Gonapodya prolifera JEL478]